MLALNLALTLTLVSLGSVWADPDEKRAAAKPASDGKNSAFEFWLVNDIKFDKNFKYNPKYPCDYNITVSIVVKGGQMKTIASVAPGQAMKAKTKESFKMVVIEITNVQVVAYLEGHVKASSEQNEDELTKLTAWNYFTEPCYVVKFDIAKTFVSSSWKPTKSKQVEWRG